MKNLEELVELLMEELYSQGITPSKKRVTAWIKDSDGSLELAYEYAFEWASENISLQSDKFRREWL